MIDVHCGTKNQEETKKLKPYDKASKWFSFRLKGIKCACKINCNERRNVFVLQKWTLLFVFQMTVNSELIVSKKSQAPCRSQYGWDNALLILFKYALFAEQLLCFNVLIKMETFPSTFQIKNKFCFDRRYFTAI